MIDVRGTGRRLVWVLLCCSAQVLAEEFRPLTSEMLEQSRQTVAAAAEQLDSFLAHGSAENAAAWKQYLKWDDLQQQLESDESADLRVLGEILAQYVSGAPGLERPPFVAVRDALIAFRRVTQGMQETDLARHHQDQLAAIEKDLQVQGDGSSGPLADLAARLEWLEQLGQSPELIAEVRQRFSHPNVLASASAETVGRGLNESVSDTSPVDEIILNTHVRGTAHTTGILTANLIPADDRAVIELTMSGEARSQTIGRQSPVRIYSRGVTQVLARKRLVIDDLGVRGLPATACCSTDNRICQIRSDRPFAANLIQNIAWKRARQQERLAERIASRRAERRVSARMDRQALDRIASGNTQLDRKLRHPLRQRDIYPRSVRLWTTGERLQLVALQGRPHQLTASSPPPAVVPHQLVAQVHTSMIANTAVSAIGGMTVTDERAQELVREVTGEVPEELQIKQDEDPWAITFDLQQPLQIEFDGDRVTIAIRCRRFLRGDQELRQATRIAANYQLGIDNGRARLNRIGEIDVTYPDKDGDRLSLLELRNKTFLANKFEGLFKPVLGGEGIQLSERWEQLRDLQLAYLSAQDGWLSMGWN